MDDVLATTGHRDPVRESWSGCHEWSRETDGRSMLEVPIRLVLAQVHPSFFLAPSALRALVELNHVWLTKLAAVCAALPDQHASRLADLVLVGPTSEAAVGTWRVPPGAYEQVYHCFDMKNDESRRTDDGLSGFDFFATGSGCASMDIVVLAYREAPRAEYLVHWTREDDACIVWEAKVDMVRHERCRAAIAVFEAHGAAARAALVATSLSILANNGEDSDGALTVRDVQTAARLILPGELAKHAVSEGTRAITKYTPAAQRTRGAGPERRRRRFS